MGSEKLESLVHQTNTAWRSGNHCVRARNNNVSIVDNFNHSSHTTKLAKILPCLCTVCRDAITPNYLDATLAIGIYFHFLTNLTNLIHIEVQNVDYIWIMVMGD